MNERKESGTTQRGRPAGSKNKTKATVERGRTGSDLPPAMQMTEGGIVSGSREETAHSSGRPKRISMNNMKKLEIPAHLMEEGYYYRWFKK